MDDNKFFNTYDRFLTTSITGASTGRLNKRYEAIFSYKDKLKGKTVLDFGAHDGRWSFAALKNGAKHITAIEPRAALCKNYAENMKFYDVPDSKYTVLQMSANEFFAQNKKRFDVILNLGLFYHVNNHLEFYEKMAEITDCIIFDTRVLPRNEKVIEYGFEDVKKERNGVDGIKGVASIGFMRWTAKQLGLKNVDIYDWHDHTRNWVGASDYQKKERMTLCVSRH